MDKNEYVCKIANFDELKENWDYLIKIHPNDNSWVEYKKQTIERFKDDRVIIYYGILNGRIISELTAMKSNLDVQNSDGLVDDKTIYLSAFRTVKDYRGKGYFSKLYKYAENDLKNRGYTKLTLGVEPNEVNNIMIYFKYGFTNYIKSSFEYELAKGINQEPRKILVNYYYKLLNDTPTKENKVIALCGKIASGKTFYSQRIDKNAVILSVDELTYYLVDNKSGVDYSDLNKRVTRYFEEKTVELVNLGCNVILDLGLWSSESRKSLRKYFEEKNIKFEIHYIDIDDEEWEENIRLRNKRIEDGDKGFDFYVTDTLKAKVTRMFEIPSREEIDVWYKFKRS